MGCSSRHESMLAHTTRHGFSCLLYAKCFRLVKDFAGKIPLTVTAASGGGAMNSFTEGCMGALVTDFPTLVIPLLAGQVAVTCAKSLERRLRTSYVGKMLDTGSFFILF
jgi:hypothetical protein